MSYKIYVLEDPIFKEVRYVGCTSSSLKRRLQQHITRATSKKDNECEELSEWINSLIDLNTAPSIKALDKNYNKNEALHSEKNWILRYKKLGADLLNKQNSINDDLPYIINHLDWVKLIDVKKLKSLFNASKELNLKTAGDVSKELNISESYISTITNGEIKNSPACKNAVLKMIKYSIETFNERFSIDLKFQDFT